MPVKLARMLAAATTLDVDTLRDREFPGVRGVAYLNAAALAPIPERARRATEAYGQRRTRPHEMRGDDFDGLLARTRAAAARLIVAEPSEIALGSNTSFGLNLAAHCLPMERGSTVVVSDREFPANVYPWMRQHSRDVRLELVPTDPLGRPDEDRLLERLDQGDVSVFALSIVQFATGFRADVAQFGRFCTERGIFFVVDAIQALGQVPVDVRAAGIDILATGGHKWLCSPFGSGFAYVRRELLSTLEPHVVGWTGMQACTDYNDLLDYRYDFLPDARRFEAATHGLQDFAGLTESLDLLQEVGIERIAAHQQRILAPLIDWLAEHPEVTVVSDLAPERRSGILCFRPPDPAGTFGALEAAGVACVLREDAIRVSPHLYNTLGDIARVVRVLEGLIR